MASVSASRIVGGRFRRRFGQADQADLRRRDQRAGAIDDERGNRRSLDAGTPALLQHGAADRQQALAVAGDAAGRDLVDDRGAAAVEPHDIAVFDDHGLLYLALAGELGVPDQMARLAMHRDRHPRPHHLVHRGQLVATRMAGDVHEMILGR